MHRRPSQLPFAAPIATPISVALLGVSLGILLAPTLAHAQAPMPMGPTAPPADAFDIRYYTTDAEGNRSRPLDQVDFTRFINKARCECGHQISTRIVLKPAMGTTYNLSTQLYTFVGTMCGAAESAPIGGQFRLCAQLKSGNPPQFQAEYNTSFHPIWLSSGVALASSADRNPSTAIAANSCENAEGQSGIWMCANTNGVSGCQSDEFFITGSQNNNVPAGMASGIAFDYLPPQTVPTDLTALPGDSAVIVSWGVLSGDIAGFRVLCEEADTGKPPPGKGYIGKDITAKQDGTIYYTKDNLCPGAPFSTFKAGNENPLDPNAPTDDTGATTDDSAGTTTDASGTTTGDSGTTDDTAGSSGSSGGVSLTCGDGVLDAGEDCDDGENNGDDKACHSNCLKDVCGDGLKGPEEQCDNGTANTDTGLCGTDCKPNGSAGLTSLDWSYVCTEHLGVGSTSARIEGLENDKKYNFMLVVYDAAGNPLALDNIVTAAPVDTRDLWEQCKADGDVCGESGFCNVAGETRGDQLLGLGALFGLGLGVRGLIRRSRRKRA